MGGLRFFWELIDVVDVVVWMWEIFFELLDWNELLDVDWWREGRMSFFCLEVGRILFRFIGMLREIRKSWWMWEWI